MPEVARALSGALAVSILAGDADPEAKTDAVAVLAEQGDQDALSALDPADRRRRSGAGRGRSGRRADHREPA